MKMYNRTTSPIQINSTEGSFTLAAAQSEGTDGPEFNLMQNVGAILVLNAAYPTVKELIDSGSIRVDPAGPVT